jgi:serine/threonine protein kinase
VFEALHIQNNKKFAVKILKKECLRNPDTLKKGFRAELKIGRHLNHPNVVKYHEIHEDYDNLYFILDLCEGGSLLTRLEEGATRYPENKAAIIVKQLLDALLYLKLKNVLHRDLKLENVLYSDYKSDQVKIIDFGLATTTDQIESRLVGTPGYMAPELIEEQDYDYQVDIYCLGIITYCLLAGSHPFDAEGPEDILNKQLDRNIRYPESLWRTLSKDSMNLITNMTLTSPTVRINAEKAINHHWITKFARDSRVFSSTLSTIKNIDPSNTSYMTNIFPSIFSTSILLPQKTPRTKMQRQNSDFDLYDKSTGNSNPNNTSHNGGRDRSNKRQTNGESNNTLTTLNLSRYTTWNGNGNATVLPMRTEDPEKSEDFEEGTEEMIKATKPLIFNIPQNFKDLKSKFNLYQKCATYH